MENIDKTVFALTSLVDIYKDVKEAKESEDKITMIEGGTLFVKHAGKAFKIVSAIQEIGEEIKDIDTKEGGELVRAVMNAYDQEGKYDNIEDASVELLQGILLVKSGIEKLLKK